jgi:hypothetical protein
MEVVIVAIERLDVICTGGIYEDPEHGPTPRHSRQKLGRLWVRHSGAIGQFGQSEPIRPCPQCGRRTRLGMSGPAWEDSSNPTDEELERFPTGNDGGVWQRILDGLNRTQPNRRVVVVDISDSCYDL